jgi:hypothetical protein
LRIKSIGLSAIDILSNSGVLTIRIFRSHYSWYEICRTCYYYHYQRTFGRLLLATQIITHLYLVNLLTNSVSEISSCNFQCPSSGISN